jgi:hypothetical protein
MGQENLAPPKNTTCLKISCNFIELWLGLRKIVGGSFFKRRVFVATSVTMACTSLFFFFLVLTSLIVETLMLKH